MPGRLFPVKITEASVRDERPIGTPLYEMKDYAILYYHEEGLCLSESR